MNKFLKYGLYAVIAGAIIGGSIILYLFNMPHRDVQGEDAAFSIEATEFVDEFMKKPTESNAKYLDQVVVISGVVAEISEDQLKQKVIVLEAPSSGISCTFTAETNTNAASLEIGNKVTIKGIVRIGPSYDEDMDLSEYGILEKCDIIN